MLAAVPEPLLKVRPEVPFKLSVPEATANATVIVVLSPPGSAAVMASPLAEANT
jgi:hypothetical protein